MTDATGRRDRLAGRVPSSGMLSSVSAPLPDGVATALSRAVLLPSWLAVGVVAVAYPLLPPLPPAVRYAPFVLSIVVFGLPHGAVDHLVPARLGGTDRRGSYLAVGLVYLVLGAAYLGWWFLHPVSAAVAFILLTWFHWGQGDVYALLGVADAEHLPTRAERGLALVVRGGLPMLVPLVAHPAEYRRVVEAFVALFDASPAALAPAFAPATRLGVGVGLGTATLLAVVLGYRRTRTRATAARGPWLVDAGELVLLWAYFALVPPVLAVGLYFCLWHALRHIARLLLVDPPAASALAAGGTVRALGRFARDAAPLTAASLVLFVALFVLVPTAPGDRESLLALYLVGIAVLTLPHVAVVTWMDLVQDVW